MTTKAELKAREGECASAEDYLRLEGDFPDTMKLAAAVWAALADAEWATRLLRPARDQVQEPLDAACLGAPALRVTESGVADELFAQSIEASQDPESLMQIMQHLSGYGLPTDQLRALYDDAGARPSGARNRLAWAEGILDLFGDRALAAQAYNQLKDELREDSERALYRYSRQHRLNRALVA